MSLKETLALTPALSPRRGGSMHSSPEFSRPLVWHCFMGTCAGCYFFNGPASLQFPCPTVPRFPRAAELEFGAPVHLSATRVFDHDTVLQFSATPQFSRMRPRRPADATASVRLSTFSLLKIPLTCDFTVASLMQRAWLIS